MLLNDEDIQTLSTPGAEFFVPRLERDEWVFAKYEVVKPLVNPFVEPFQGNNIVSYGLTSAGYDLRIDNEEVLFYKNSYGHPADPKRFKDPKYREEMFDRRTFAPHDEIMIPPNGYILARSYEWLYVPYFLCGTVVGKSTYARCGLVVNTTPLEPEWEGHLTIEISNPTLCGISVHALEGIGQLRYELLARRPKQTYADKAGKYQSQVGVTPARMKE